MSHIARKFSVVRFVTLTDFDPQFNSLKEGANHTHTAFSRSPKESDCFKVSIQTGSLRHLQKAKTNHVKKRWNCPTYATKVQGELKVEASWNVMAHVQKPDLVLRRNGRVHLNRRGASVQSTTGSRVLCNSGSNAGYTMFRGSVKGTGYPLIRQFPLHFPSRASPCTITFQLESTAPLNLTLGGRGRWVVDVVLYVPEENPVYIKTKFWAAVYRRWQIYRFCVYFI